MVADGMGKELMTKALMWLRVERSRARILIAQACRLTVTTRQLLEQSRRTLARTRELTAARRVGALQTQARRRS
jgi:hypothetical protein